MNVKFFKLLSCRGKWVHTRHGSMPPSQANNGQGGFATEAGTGSQTIANRSTIQSQRNVGARFVNHRLLYTITRKTQRCEAITEIYLGLDVGKTTHHATALTTTGKKIWDKPLPQSEPKIRELLEKLSTQGTVLLVVEQPKTIGALPVAIAQRYLLHKEGSHPQDNGPTRQVILRSALKPYQERPLPHRSTTGLTATQFATLITSLANHLSWVKPAEKSRRLALAHLI